MKVSADRTVSRPNTILCFVFSVFGGKAVILPHIGLFNVSATAQFNGSFAKESLVRGFQARHPIKVDRGSARSDHLMSSSTQVSFHKIYRQKRRYSILDKGKEGHSSSQWRSDCANSPRDSNPVSEPKYCAGPSGFKTTRRADIKETIKSGSHFSSFPTTGSAKNDREYSKRSYNRFACNFASGPEFDTPVIKKQKADSYKPSAPLHGSPEFDDGKPKMALDETKWMYKNHNAKMSGPYGVKQLMEGLQARFLQEDLPIYQLYEGKLCEPITLNQLMNDLQWSVRDSGRRHPNQSMPCQRFLQGSVEETANEVDLPPGFGGRSCQISEKSSRMYSPNSMSSMAGPRCSARAFSSSTSELGDTDICLPPGFEGGAATESQTTDLSETPRMLSMGVGVAASREEVRGVYSNYDQMETVVHDRIHSSWHGNSPHSKVSFTQQGAKTGSEISSNGHAVWAYAPASTKVLSFEHQTFSQPIVCIGLPVSKPTTQSWPIARQPSGVSKAEPYSFVQANNAFATKDPAGFPERHAVDPLTLILSELLAAVKRTYVNSVLSALIGEQLEFWLDANKTWTGTSLPSDKDGLSRGAFCTLSRVEIGIGSAEASTSHIEASGNAKASTLHIEASTANSSGPDGSSDGRDAQHAEGSCLVSHALSSGENQWRPLIETRNNAYPVVMADTLLSSNTEENGLGYSKLSLSSGKAEDLSLDPNKVESFLSVDETCKLSSKSSSSPGNEPSQILSVLKEERQHHSGEEILFYNGSNCRFQSPGNTSDAILSEAEPPFLATRSKKVNLRSLKHLMLITSKLRSRRSKSGLLKKNGSTVLCRMSPEVLEIRQNSEILTSEDYDGCARTSVCGWSWHKRAQDDSHCVRNCKNEDQRFKSGGSGVSTHLKSLAQLAQSHGHLGRLATAAESSDMSKLALSKVSKKRLKVARSKIHNWGVFPVVPVEAGDFVIEYLGELVRSRIADIREEHYAKLGIGNGYLFRIDDECVVDATKQGGLARFINHSCDPNCYIKIVIVDGSKRILIFAKMHIQAGEELTYDYKSVHGVQNFLCSCGSTKCRGSF